MKFQALLTSLYFLLSSSSAKQINDTAARDRESRTPKTTTTIYHNGRPIEVLRIPDQRIHPQQFQHQLQLASNTAPFYAEHGPKIALKRDKIIIKNENNYLQDSYGNRFYGPPQNQVYKMSFPQEFVALQDLPSHFSQPHLGTTLHAQPALHAQPTYSLPQFSFSESSNRQPVLQSDSGFYNHPAAVQSSPFILQHQQLNIPLQSHYRIGDSTPVINGKHYGPISYTYHKTPSYDFPHFAADNIFHHHVPGPVPGAQINKKAANHKTQNNNKKQNSKNDGHSETASRPEKQQEPRKQVTKPIIVQQEVSTIDPQYFQPQVFANPIVAQVQHYLPKIQNVLRYNIDPRPQAPIVSDPENHVHQSTPYDNQVKQILSKPHNKNNFVVNEFTEPEKHEHREQVKAEVVNEEENEENNFNQGYDAAAEGFPAFTYGSDHDKNIYNEDSYGEPHYDESFGPESDESIPDKPDKQKSKFVISSSLQHNSYGDENANEFKPIPYEITIEKQTPQHVEKIAPGKWSKKFSRPHKQPKTAVKSAEYRELELPYQFSTRKFNPGNKKSKAPQKLARHEVDYTKGYPHHSRRPEQHKSHQNLKVAEQAKFVEPQYHYGFEPILESQEVDNPASSALNLSPEIEVKPNTMKKVFKENWYISKSSSSEAGLDS